MLGNWRSHSEYQSFVVNELSVLTQINPNALLEYDTGISKASLLDLDPLKELLAPLYGSKGRPSEFQLEIFRSLILMNAYCL